MVLDAGAFIALERRDETMVALVSLFAQERIPLVTSAAVVAQVWRASPRQAPLAFLLRRTAVVDLTEAVARILGRMLGATGQSDPVDAHVVLLARERGWPILTSDPDDLRALDPKARLEVV
jgi:hypothetical protein